MEMEGSTKLYPPPPPLCSFVALRWLSFWFPRKNKWVPTDVLLGYPHVPFGFPKEKSRVTGKTKTRFCWTPPGFSPGYPPAPSQRTNPRLSRAPPLAIEESLRDAMAPRRATALRRMSSTAQAAGLAARGGGREVIVSGGFFAAAIQFWLARNVQFQISTEKKPFRVFRMCPGSPRSQVRGGFPEVRFHEGSTRFCEDRMLPGASTKKSTACCWGYHLSLFCSGLSLLSVFLGCLGV